VKLSPTVASVDESVPTAVLLPAVLLTELLVKAMAVGVAVSTVIVRPDEATEVLPAASVALAVMVWVPALNADEVMLQVPPVATAVPSTVVPSVSYSVTVLPDSAVPVKTGVVLLVMLSVLSPVSVALVMSGVLGAEGADVSSV